MPINGRKAMANWGEMFTPISGVMGPYYTLLITGFWPHFEAS